MIRTLRLIVLLSLASSSHFIFADNSPTLIDIYKPPPTDKRVVAQSRIITEFDVNDVNEQGYSATCKILRNYLFYDLAGFWDLGFIISLDPLPKHDMPLPHPVECNEPGGEYEDNLLRLVLELANQQIAGGVSSAHMTYEFDKEGGCADGKLYYWETAHIYLSENRTLERAYYTVGAAC